MGWRTISDQLHRSYNNETKKLQGGLSSSFVRSRSLLEAYHFQEAVNLNMDYLLIIIISRIEIDKSLLIIICLHYLEIVVE